MKDGIILWIDVFEKGVFEQEVVGRGKVVVERALTRPKVKTSGARDGGTCGELGEGC